MATRAMHVALSVSPDRAPEPIAPTEELTRRPSPIVDLAQVEERPDPGPWEDAGAVQGALEYLHSLVPRGRGLVLRFAEGSW